MNIFKRLFDQEPNISTAITTSQKAYRAFELTNYKKAVFLYKKAVSLFRKINNKDGEDDALYDLAGAYMRLENYGGAIQALNSALEIAIQIGDREREMRNLGRLGDVFCEGDSRSAEDYYNKQYDIAKELGSHDFQGAA